MEDCGSSYSKLFGDDNFGKKVIYDFVFLGTYVGDFGDEWVCMIEYFDRDDIVEKLFAKYKVHPLSQSKDEN